MNDQSELELKIRERLEEIKAVPPRDPAVARHARMEFMARAVSASDAQRHKGWISIFRKERFAMNMMISVLVIAGLLFGGGATVSAAQNDLPGEPLYALKMWTEELSLQFQNDPEQKVDRLMKLAQVRVHEMTRLTDAGQPVPDQLRLRIELHVQQALQICSSMPDAALERTLLQLRDRLQEQDRDMERLQIHAQPDAQPVLEHTRTMLQQHLQLVNDGLLNHEMFRNTVRNGFRTGQEDGVTPPGQNDNGQQNGQPTTAPAGPNPDPKGTSTGPGEPNPDPGGSGPGSGPGEPNTSPGGPNKDSGEPKTGSGGSGMDGGSGSGGNKP
jgi:hypothetical protein